MIDILDSFLGITLFVLSFTTIPFIFYHYASFMSSVKDRILRTYKDNTLSQIAAFFINISGAILLLLVGFICLLNFLYLMKIFFAYPLPDESTSIPIYIKYILFGENKIKISSFFVQIANLLLSIGSGSLFTSLIIIGAFIAYWIGVISGIIQIYVFIKKREWTTQQAKVNSDPRSVSDYFKDLID